MRPKSTIWTDEDGNISYHDKPPPRNGEQVEEKSIDPNKNIVQPFRNPINKGSSKSKTIQGAPVTTIPSDGNKDTSNQKADIAESGNLDPVDPASGANPNPLQTRPAPLVTPAPLSAPPAPTAPPLPDHTASGSLYHL